MSICYKHSECGTTERIDIASIPLSTWLVGKKSTLRSVVNAAPDESYFLLPAYLKRATSIISDWQPQISGKAKVCETRSGAMLGAQREILEEIGFAFPLTSLSSHGSEIDKGSIINFFSVTISDRALGTVDTAIRTECIARSADVDERRMRISVHVVFTGTECELLTTLAERKRITSTDTGGSVIVAVPKAILLTYL